MPATTAMQDCKRFAESVASAGGVLPPALGHLIAADDLLSAAPPTQAPESAIIDAALAGQLTAKKLDELILAAAAQRQINVFRQELARASERHLVSAFHKALKAGAADAVLDSLRPTWDKHAEQIAKARSLLPEGSTAEQILNVGEPAIVGAWQALGGHLEVIGRIARVACAFGPRLGNFPQIEEYPLAENARLSDQALMCTGGPLLVDSAPFQRPDSGHRSSPWARVPLQLHSIASARARYRAYAADEFDRQHSGPGESYLIDGKQVPVKRPENPYRDREKVTTQ